MHKIHVLSSRFEAQHAMKPFAPPNYSFLSFLNSHAESKLLLFCEKHAKANDGSVNEQASNNTHGHRSFCDQIAVCKHCWHSNPHSDKPSCQESSKFNYACSISIHKIIMCSCPSAQPVWNGCKDISKHNKKCEVVLP